MKKILLGLCAILGLINMTGCSSDEKYPMPTTIDQNSLSAEAKAGAIKLKWTVPADSNYYYVKVTYTLPEDGKKCLRLASVIPCWWITCCTAMATLTLHCNHATVRGKDHRVAV